MRRLLVIGTVFVLMILASTGVAGPKLEMGEGVWFQPAFLGQVHYRHNDNAADQEDFYLRRGRIILKGQIMDGVKFFMETDNDNAGKSGTSGVSTDIQDAFMDVRLVENDVSHQLIEECMIAANEAVAQALHEAGAPVISRFHDVPAEEKIGELTKKLCQLLPLV